MSEVKVCARVLTDDRLFGRMIETELARMGFSLNGEEETALLVLDLDSGEDVDFEKYKNAFVLGYSRSDRVRDSEEYMHCNTFLRRPFRMSEFCKTVIYGTGIQGQAASFGEYASQVRQSKLSVDKAGGCAIYGDRRFDLSEYEIRVLELLCKRRGEAVSREEICELLGGGNSNMVDVYICRLRNKIDSALGLKLIQTVRSKGYMLKK